MVNIEVKRFEAFSFDLDGVITRTASLHARAWQGLFDEFLRQQARKTGIAFAPFDPERDYRLYVDGKPRFEAFGLKTGECVVTIHCGSRGLGHQIGTEFLREMAIATERYGIELPDRELACAPIKSELGNRYLRQRRGRCPRCRALLTALKTGGRTGYFCPRCQSRRAAH